METVRNGAQYRLDRFGIWNLEPPPPLNEREFRIASLNARSAWVSDSEANLEKYPKYAWQNRLRPISQLIHLDRPLILALSELTLTQVKDLLNSTADLRYRFAGYSSETREPVDVVEQRLIDEPDLNYGEFEGFLYSEQVVLTEVESIELPKGEKHKRNLTKGSFIHTAFGVNFVVLTMHFDHLSSISRWQSGQRELVEIRKLEEQRIPWFSIGDRNWSSLDKNWHLRDRNLFFESEGLQHAKEYVKYDYICDFRDSIEDRHYGPHGTFPGYSPIQSTIKHVRHVRGIDHFRCDTLDVGFRSRTTIIGVNSYAYTGEFDPETYELLPIGLQGDVSQKNFLSDHFYIGGTFRFR